MLKPIAVALWFVSAPAFSQNLVVDPSFENYIPNPNGYYLQDYLYDWASYNVTADYYNSSLNPLVIAYTGTDARSGSGFVGGYTFGHFDQWGGGTAYNREYVYGQLASPLEAGRYYDVEFFVKPMSKPPVIPYCIDRIDIFFSGDTLNHVPDHFLQVVNPQIENDNGTVCNEQEWTRVHGCFKARGGERFLTIGNFDTDFNTQHQLLAGDTLMNGIDPQAYYLFDDVSVMPLGPKPLPPHYTVCFDSSVTLDATFTNASTYHWNTGETTPQIVVSSPGQFIVEIVTDGGCLIVDTTHVVYENCIECKPIFPNAFTPNGDGLNEFFGPLSSCYYTQYRLTVYDRWGEETFRTNDPLAHWDGHLRGRLCPTGVYAFVLRAVSPLHSELIQVHYSGNVTLLR